MNTISHAIAVELTRLGEEKTCRYVAEVTGCDPTTVWRHLNGHTKIPLGFIYSLEEHELIDPVAVHAEKNKEVVVATLKEFAHRLVNIWQECDTEKEFARCTDDLIKKLF